MATATPYSTLARTIAESQINRSAMSLPQAKAAFDAAPCYLTGRNYAMSAVMAFEVWSIGHAELEAILGELERWLKGSC